MTRRNRGRIARYVAGLLIVTAVPLSLLVRRIVDPVDRIDPRHSGAAPAFELQSLDGQPVSLAGLRGVPLGALRGQPVVVNFWGAWCEQCTLELPLLAEMHRRHPGVAIVGILFREDPAVARAAAAKGDATWPTLIDPDGRVAAAYGVDGAPATFFIRPDGTIAGDLLGPVSIGILDKQFRRISE
ncbi:MAG TPA: TlpA disulfide reductase family protein [Acidimicrobiia bacterium]|nr:TlpA disulfide reductase family protein [Acidimicrobiia bacterium]